MTDTKTSDAAIARAAELADKRTMDDSAPTPRLVPDRPSDAAIAEILAQLDGDLSFVTSPAEALIRPISVWASTLQRARDCIAALSAAPPAEAPADAVDSITRKLYADMLEGGAIVRIDPSAMFAHGVQWDSGSPCMEPRPVGMVYPPLPPPRASGYLDDSGVEWNAYDTAQMEAYARDAVASYYAAPAAPAEGNSWALAEKVRTALDKQACPDHFMRVAMESIVENYTAPRVTGGREVEAGFREGYKLGYSDGLTDGHPLGGCSRNDEDGAWRGSDANATIQAANGGGDSHGV